jgi:uncharacterized protein
LINVVLKDNMKTKSTWFVTPGQCFLFGIVLFLFVWSDLSAQPRVPELWGHRVHDEAHVLSPATIDHLDQMLKLHEDSTSNQIAILIIPTLDGAVLEEYSLHVAHDVWKLGQQKNDNGVLLLIAVEDHKTRIEVGQGLEGVLTDALCSRIIRNEIAPRFRENNYDAGVQAGTEAIVKAIAGEYSVEDNAVGEELGAGERIFMGLFIFGILGLFTCIGLFTPGCGGWFLYAFLIPFYAVFPWIVIGMNAATGLFGVYIIGFPILKLMIGRTAWGKRLSSKMKNTRGGSGGWSSGSGWFGGSSGGSSSGGGFSGGGGSFGGGGSSGSW